MVGLGQLQVRVLWMRVDEREPNQGHQPLSMLVSRQQLADSFVGLLDLAVLGLLWVLYDVRQKLAQEVNARLG